MVKRSSRVYVVITHLLDPLFVFSMFRLLYGNRGKHYGNVAMSFSICLPLNEDRPRAPFVYISFAIFFEALKEQIEEASPRGNLKP